MGFWRKKKSEKGNGALRGEPDYSSIRVVPGHYIEKDVDAVIDAINKSGILKKFSKSSNRSEQASDNPHRSSEDPE